MENILANNLLKNLKSALVVINTQGEILMINEAAGRILGVNNISEAIGKSCRKVFRNFPYLSDLLLTSFSIHALPDRAELELEGTPNKDRKTIGYTLSPIFNDNQERIGTALFFKDLTEVELEETQEKIKDRLITLGEMAAWLAHEIRNPLAGIEVSAGILLRGEDDPQRSELTRDIIGEVKRLNRIIKQTLDFVRPRPINLQECNINNILKYCLEEYLDDRNDIQVEMSLEDLKSVLLDDTQIILAIGNIIKNCYEAMDNGGALKLRSYTIPSESSGNVPEAFADYVIREDRNIVVEIEDTGGGIGEEVMDKIFTPFFTTKSGGTGIGMSIAQKIIAGHWGFLDVESWPGRGTRFKVILPMFIPIPEE